MAKISNTTVYPNIIPTANDFVVLTDVSDSDATKTCTVNDLQDYFGTKTLVTTLTSSQILNLNVTPVVLLTCKVGEYIDVLSTQWILNFNKNAYVGGTTILLSNNGDVLSFQSTLAAGAARYNAAVDAAGRLGNAGDNFNYPIAAGGNSLTVQAATAPTLGDSPITLNIQYRIVTF